MTSYNQYTLLTQRRFVPYFIVQCLGGFNDNVLRLAINGFLAFLMVSDEARATYAMLLPAIFILPYLLFGAAAGQIAEKLEKQRLIVITTTMEIAVMLLAAAGFLLHSIPILLTALFATGLQSTLFGPVKYSILPSVLRPEELTGGNGLVEMGTSIFILLGMICGGLIFPLSGDQGVWVAGALLIGLAVAGNITARRIPRVDAGQPDLQVRWNPVRESWKIWKLSSQRPAVRKSMLGISWFWFYGTLVTSQLLVADQFLGGGDSFYILPYALFALSIGAGSLLCERLSGRIVELGLVPLGAFGMSAFLMDFSFAAPAVAAAEFTGITQFLHAPGSARVLADLVGIGLFTGFFIVPLYALIQSRAPKQEMARTFAALNIQNALFMIGASAAGMLAINWLGWSIPQLLLALAIANALVAFHIFTMVPEFLMRFLVWLLIRVLYRLRLHGIEKHVPDEGPALLVCNHVTFMDAMLLSAAIPRPARFVMHQRIFQMPVLRWIFRTARAIPIASGRDDPALLQRAFDEIDAALADGQLVCIFPEGALTTDGEIAPFRKGVEQILDRRAVPVVPLALRGMWSSMWSRRNEQAARGTIGRMRLPRRLRARVEVAAGPPVDGASASAAQLEFKVRELRGAAA